MFFHRILFMNPATLQHSTIRNYVCHVRTNWLTSGAPLTPFDNQIVTRVLRGVATLRPCRPDPRVAFLLPHLKPPPIFNCPLTTDQLLYKAATIYGFFRHVTVWNIRQTDAAIDNTGVCIRRPVHPLGLKHGTHTGLYLVTRYHRVISKFRGKVPPKRWRLLLHTPGPT